MMLKPNPRQLVLRRDTATGLTLVGWETDLPLGRFEHIDLIGEFKENILPDISSELYDIYQAALLEARQANLHVLEQQVQHHQSKGWYKVPFELAKKQEPLEADPYGNYAAAAMQLYYQLAENQNRTWAIIREDVIVHVRARYPKKRMDRLTYQVWYHKQQHELKEMGGVLLEGNLFACESGLWFEEIKE